MVNAHIGPPRRALFLVFTAAGLRFLGAHRCMRRERKAEAPILAYGRCSSASARARLAWTVIDRPRTRTAGVWSKGAMLTMAQTTGSDGSLHWHGWRRTRSAWHLVDLHLMKCRCACAVHSRALGQQGNKATGQQSQGARKARQEETGKHRAERPKCRKSELANDPGLPARTRPSHRAGPHSFRPTASLESHPNHPVPTRSLSDLLHSGSHLPFSPSLVPSRPPKRAPLPCTPSAARLPASPAPCRHRRRHRASPRRRRPRRLLLSRGSPPPGGPTRPRSGTSRLPRAPALPSTQMRKPALAPPPTPGCSTPKKRSTLSLLPPPSCKWGAPLSRRDRQFTAG